MCCWSDFVYAVMLSYKTSYISFANHSLDFPLILKLEDVHGNKLAKIQFQVFGSSVTVMYFCGYVSLAIELGI